MHQTSETSKYIVYSETRSMWIQLMQKIPLPGVEERKFWKEKKQNSVNSGLCGISHRI